MKILTQIIKRKITTLLPKEIIFFFRVLVTLLNYFLNIKTLNKKKIGLWSKTRISVFFLFFTNFFYKNEGTIKIKIVRSCIVDLTHSSRSSKFG